jgi:hypothetical protein
MPASVLLKQLASSMCLGSNRHALLQACYGHTSKSKGSAFLWYEQQQHAITAIRAMHGQLCLPRRHSAPARPLTVRPALHSRKQAPLAAPAFGGPAAHGAYAGAPALPVYGGTGLYGTGGYEGCHDPQRHFHGGGSGGYEGAHELQPPAQQYGGAPQPCSADPMLAQVPDSQSLYRNGSATHAQGGGAAGEQARGAQRPQDVQGMLDTLQMLSLGAGGSGSGPGGSGGGGVYQGGPDDGARGYQGEPPMPHNVHSAQRPASYNTLTGPPGRTTAASGRGGYNGSGGGYGAQQPLSEAQLQQLRSMVSLQQQQQEAPRGQAAYARYGFPEHGSADLGPPGSSYDASRRSTDFSAEQHALGTGGLRSVSVDFRDEPQFPHGAQPPPQQAGHGDAGGPPGAGDGGEDQQQQARYEAALSAHSAALSLLHSSGSHSQGSQAALTRPGSGAGGGQAQRSGQSHGAPVSDPSQTSNNSRSSQSNAYNNPPSGTCGVGGGAAADGAQSCERAGSAASGSPSSARAARWARMPDGQLRGAGGAPPAHLASASAHQSSLPSMPELQPLSAAGLPHLGVVHGAMANRANRSGHPGPHGAFQPTSGTANDPGNAWAVQSAGWSSSSSGGCPGGPHMRSAEYGSLHAYSDAGNASNASNTCSALFAQMAAAYGGAGGSAPPPPPHHAVHSKSASGERPARPQARPPAHEPAPPMFDDAEKGGCRAVPSAARARSASKGEPVAERRDPEPAGSASVASGSLRDLARHSVQQPTPGGSCAADGPQADRHLSKLPTA